jgi:putative ABC transport system permease protein
MSLLLAARLAWRQLVHVPVRFASAIAGVIFAALLVFMQLGFHDALYDSATSTARALRGDLVVVHASTRAMFQPTPLPRARLMQAHGMETVDRVVPVLLTQLLWRNPETGTRRSIMVLGADPDAGAFDVPELAALAPALRQRDTLAFDVRSRAEYGPMAERFHRGDAQVLLGNRTATVVGLFGLGASFAADGNVVTSELNFQRLAGGRPVDVIDLGLVFLAPGADPAVEKARLAAMLPDDVRVLTRAEFVALERAYWETSAAIGFIFTFGVVMGLVVGLVIVYQILFTDIASHLAEYATLKAMGYRDGHLLAVVFAEALILAVGGFVPGLVAALVLYDVSAAATFLPMALSTETAAFVFVLILAMCAGSGALAVRKLRDAQPADMF